MTVWIPFGKPLTVQDGTVAKQLSFTKVMTIVFRTFPLLLLIILGTFLKEVCLSLYMADNAWEGQAMLICLRYSFRG